eukprot:TRINITY_DN2021_c4_g2_i1.p1 TRINITY_DN2021_c4_g2~~TRINITY_DN2021_c4_g2_i1.p1  ORF type:complete len:1404 (-),score=366.79 TRINITY_DN2021_c4_g2_i1:51-4172(-)
MSTHRLHKWNNARVFISSTFRDMHGERDYLTRYVFPELQERCNKIHVHVTPVDLRWGVTEEDTGQALEMCLTEIDNCRPFFIGLLGNRYGWVPDKYELPDLPQFEWVKKVSRGNSVTHMEVLHGCLNAPDKCRAAFYFRDSTFMNNVPSELLKDFESENDHAAEHLKRLKQHIKAAGVTVYENYPCLWKGMVDNKPMVAGLEQFGQHVLEFLWNSFVQHFHFEESGEDPISALRAGHESFIEMHSRSFIGRRKLLDTLHEHIKSSGEAPMVVVGEPGGGKTSLMAAFAREMMRSQSDGNVFVLPHFIGGTAGSTDLRKTLERLDTELAQVLGHKEEIPEDFNELKELFGTLLGTKAKEHFGTIVVILDALNQLDQSFNSHSLDWLPTAFPSNVRVVVSTLKGKCLDVLRRRTIEELVVGPLTKEEQKEIVRKTLWEYRKKLDERGENDQMGLLISKQDACKPLYLIVACEELRVFGVFEELTNKIRAMANSIPALFQDVLARLEQDHGHDLVMHALCLIKASRGGLLEHELLATLGYAGSMLTQMYGQLKQALALNIWSRLYRSLKAFLLPLGEAGEGNLSFFHQQLGFAVQARYFSGASGKTTCEKVHRRLAEYFNDLADPRHNATWAGVARGLSELPYHLVFGDTFGELHRILCDLCFIETKCRAGMAFDLVADYLRVSKESAALDTANGSENGGTLDQLAVETTEMAKSFWQRYPVQCNQLKDFQSFVQFRVHVLTKKPFETFALAANLPSKSAPAIAAADRWTRALETRPWLEWTNKPQEADPCVLTFAGHSMVARSVQLNPVDPLTAVSCADDSTVRVWNTSTGEETLVLKGHRSSVMGCCFNVDGTVIASASYDKTIKLWNAQTGVELSTLCGHKSCVNKVAFSPSGLLCSASQDKTVRVWDRDGHELACLKDHTLTCTGCCFSPDSKRLASCSQDRTIKLWDTTTYALIRTLSGHSKAVNAVKFSPAGKHLLSAGDDRAAILWNVETGEKVQTFTDHKDGVCDCDFMPDGQHIVTTSHDNMVRVYNVGTGDIVHCLLGHTGSVFCCCAASDSIHIATCSFDRSAKIWDLRLAKSTVTGHTARILAVAYNATGSLVVTASRDKTLKLWDVATCRELLTLAGHTSNVFACGFSPSGDLVLSGSRDSTMKLWDTKTGICTRTLMGHKNIVYGCCFSPDGKKIVSASADKLVKLWDTETGADLATLYGHRSDVLCVAWSPDGNKIVTGSEDYTLKLWNARTHRKLATFTGHTKGVHCCAFSPDSTKILSGSDDNLIKEWDARNSKCLATIAAHTATVKAVRYSLDGRKIISGSTDSSVIIFDVVTKAQLCSFTCLSRITCLNVPPAPLLRSNIVAGDGSGGLYLFTPVGL